MTYEKRYEVLEAAAQWMRVCEKAGITAIAKYYGEKDAIVNMALDGHAEFYEFPLALLEGKEVWVGSELYDRVGGRFVVTESDKDDDVDFRANGCSWSKPKPATVMVEMPVEDAESYSKYTKMNSLAECCKKALENLK